jgi:hypothetical protein
MEPEVVDVVFYLPNSFTKASVTGYNVFRFSSQFRHGGVSPRSSMIWLVVFSRHLSCILAI